MLKMFLVFHVERPYIRTLFYLRQWNSLPVIVRNSQSLAIFKTHLNENRRRLPKYFYTGTRKLQVLHTRLRTKCSSLNYHLYLRGISPTALCRCGKIENNYHFFFECQIYENCRRILLHNLQGFEINLNILLHGNPNLSDEENAYIFAEVHSYIHDSQRFG